MDTNKYVDSKLGDTKKSLILWTDELKNSSGL